MAFDYKKEQKEIYQPKAKPSIVTVPKMNYLAVRGKGNPNEEGGEYQQAIQTLFPVAYALRMSYKTDYKIEGFFEYVVPPLEGFWWIENLEGMDYNRKDDLEWISVLRLPDFITKKDFEWAINQVTTKKKIDCSKVEFFTYDEGLCVQMMHIGHFDNETETVELMQEFIKKEGYVEDFEGGRMHHEVYITDIRKSAPEKWKTVVRHPIKKG